MKPSSLIKYFQRDQSGFSTIMALFWFILCAGIVGLAVDTSNAWRQKERLQLTADVAAHAGAIELMNGESTDVARIEAKDSALSNMPSSGFGQVINDETKDIIFSHYNASTNELEASGEMDAVTVQLHRNNTVNNPVGTYLLKFAGFPDWEVKRYGTAVYVDFELCPHYEGIWATGNIKASSDNVFNTDYCVHSQDFVDLPQQNEFISGSYLGMPNLILCNGKCQDSENMGATDAAHEINLDLPSFDAKILEVEAAMLSSATSDIKTDFWTGKTVESDIAVLQPLIDMGALPDPLDPIYDPNNPIYDDPLYKPDSPIFDPSSPAYDSDAVLLTIPTYELPNLGDVVVLTQDEFETLDGIPKGLTYDVACTANGNGPNTRLDIYPASSGDPVLDVAVITNCSIEFQDDSDWRGSLVLTSKVSANPTLSASANASVGDPTQSCNQSLHTYIFARSKMYVAAKFASSNTTFMTGSDFSFASGAAAETWHYGMTLYADGSVDLTTNHNYFACGYDGNLFLDISDLKYVKMVIPSNEGARLASFN